MEFLKDSGPLDDLARGGGTYYKWLGAWHIRGRLVAEVSITTCDMSKSLAAMEMRAAHPFDRRYPSAQLTITERHTIAKSGVGRTPD